MQGKVFYLNVYPRLLDIFNRYPIDLLLICEETELVSVHERKRLDHPDYPPLPKFLQTTFVECPSGAGGTAGEGETDSNSLE